MFTFFSFLGLLNFLINLLYYSRWNFEYYRTMKDSVLTTFELDEKKLIPQRYIYQKIFFYFFLFLYSTFFDFNFIYLVSIVNSVIYLSILNMHLFIIKKKNQLLLQTLICVIILKILYLIRGKIKIFIIIFLCSIDIVNWNETKILLREGLLLTYGEDIVIKMAIESFLALLWIVYAISQKLWFFSIFYSYILCRCIFLLLNN